MIDKHEITLNELADHLLNPVDPTGLIIHKAMYGTVSHCQDVTRLVRTLVKDNRLDFKPGTALFGDPFPNEYKCLTVDYTFEGVRLQKEFPQDVWVSIP